MGYEETSEQLCAGADGAFVVGSGLASVPVDLIVLVRFAAIEPRDTEIDSQVYDVALGVQGCIEVSGHCSERPRKAMRSLDAALTPNARFLSRSNKGSNSWKASCVCFEWIYET